MKQGILILILWSSAWAGNTLTSPDGGITWTFDKEVWLSAGDETHYQYGTFITGDYYIVGSCVVSSVSPASEQYVQSSPGTAGTFWINGSMVNPQTNFRAGPSYASDQAFDQRSPTWNASLGASFPLNLGTNESLISVRSWKIEDSGHPPVSSGVMRPLLRYSGILTCLASAPASSAFRPPYAGSSKPVHLVSSVDVSFLPDLACPTTYYPWSTMETRMKYCWAPDFSGLCNGEWFHPSTHMDSYYFYLQMQDVALTLLLDDSAMETRGYPSGWKNTLAYRMIQNGIDNYAVASLGVRWGRSGGNMGGGHKFPILFAGLALNDSDMKNIMTTMGESAYNSYFLEDNARFYATQTLTDTYTQKATRTNCTITAEDLTHITDADNNSWLYDDNGQLFAGTYPSYGPHGMWAVIDYGTSKTVVLTQFSIAVDGNGTSSPIVSGTHNEILALRPDDNHPVTPGTGLTVIVRQFPQERVGMPDWNARYWYWQELGWTIYMPQERQYRDPGCQYAGQALAVLAMDAGTEVDFKGLWDQDAFFDYADMMMPMTASGDRTGSVNYTRFVWSMWDTHRDSYGAIWPDTDEEPMNPVLAAIGSKSVFEGVELAFSISATDPGEETITYTMSSVPTATGATLDDETGAFAWTPTTSQSGIYQITFTATNESLLTDYEVVTVTVTDSTPHTPIISQIGILLAYTNAAYSGGITAEDADKDVLTYTFDGLPSGISGNASTGELTGTPTTPGKFRSKVTASDGVLEDVQYFYWRIVNPTIPIQGVF